MDKSGTMAEPYGPFFLPRKVYKTHTLKRDDIALKAVHEPTCLTNEPHGKWGGANA